ncbi:hypothetical protein Tco_1118861, partial [Tanacetum coccineum]
MGNLLSELESALFSIKLHYGGVFTKSPNRKYINGNITFVDMIDSDEFSVHKIDSMLEDLGQDGHRVMFYHFLKPGCDLDNGLEPIACDRDVVVLGNYVTQGLKLVEVFVEHEKTNPDIYTPPKAKRLVIEELDAEPIISKAGITPVARKLVLDVNNNQTCGKEKGKSNGKDLEGQSSAVGNDGSYEETQDPNFDPFTDLDLILPTMGDREDMVRNTVGDHEIHDKEEREVDDDTDRNMEGNSGHVVETEGEENEQAAETESEEDTEANDETDSEDSDYLVDEENNVDDVDVDMKDFDFHVDEGVEFMSCRGVDRFGYRVIRRRHGKCVELRVVLILKAKSASVPGILGRGSLSCVRRTSGVRSTANDVAYQVAYSPADWKVLRKIPGTPKVTISRFYFNK